MEFHVPRLLIVQHQSLCVISQHFLLRVYACTFFLVIKLMLFLWASVFLFSNALILEVIHSCTHISSHIPSYVLSPLLCSECYQDSDCQQGHSCLIPQYTCSSAYETVFSVQFMGVQRDNIGMADTALLCKNMMSILFAPGTVGSFSTVLPVCLFWAWPAFVSFYPYDFLNVLTTSTEYYCI